MFPYYLPEPCEGPTDAVDESLGVVTGWKATEKTVEVEPYYNDYPYYYSYAENMMVDAAPRANAGSVSGNGFGIGGSMARFTLFDEYLYAINQSSLKLFDISMFAHVRSCDPVVVEGNYA